MKYFIILIFMVFIGNVIFGDKIIFDENRERNLVRIPYYDSGEELILNFPKCNYGHRNIEGVQRSVFLYFPRPTFTGNYQKTFNCPFSKDSATVSLQIGTTSNFKIQGQKDFTSNEYRAAFFEYGQKKDSKLEASKNNMKIYRSGIGINAILVGDFKEKKHWLMIEYHDYDPHLIDSGFMQVFKITTYLNSKYQLEYEVYTSQWLNNDDSGLKVDTKFADDFRNVVQNKDDNIIDHPEIIKEFILNNESVIQYVKQNSKEVSNNN
ncbi:hypothetical protein [Acinetobacter sp. P8-3-8]|uniref:hypothetical protein n=1 Tax=Acinetobacter sp. P8-3-8 TaxID=1029823 RepID=UPI0002485D4B|nr:hypothetical protein [Acinetobacter sp. P8-3-8]